MFADLSHVPPMGLSMIINAVALICMARLLRYYQSVTIVPPVPMQANQNYRFKFIPISSAMTTKREEKSRIYREPIPLTQIDSQ